MAWSLANVSANDELHLPDFGEVGQIFLLDIIPDCLLASNSSFQVAFFYLLNDQDNPVDRGSLEQLSILTYKMNIIYLQQRLWQVYLQSGTGQLRSLVESHQHELAVAPQVWPLQVSELLIAYGDTQTKNVDDQTHLDFVQKYLSVLSKHHQRYRAQFNTIKSQLNYFTDALGYHMERYVLANALAIVQLYFDARIALIKHAYTDRWLQLNFLQHKPNDEQVSFPSLGRSVPLSCFQIQLANRICQLTFSAENTREEHVLFKTGVFYKKLPRSFHLLDTSLPASIKMIQDPAVRDALSQDYRRVIERTNVDLAHVLTSACQAAKVDCEKTLNTTLAEMWRDQRRLPNSARLSSTMLSLIEQRQKNITACVTQIYSLKSDFLLKIPTMTAIRD